MKRIIGLLLALCVLCACGAAWAEEWTCVSCGKAGNDGNFCPNCGARRAENASGDEEAAAPETEWKGKQLNDYYINAAARGLDTPCLTNLIRVRDGQLEASCLAVALYDPDSHYLGILAGETIVSEGCEYEWQCGVKERYEVELGSPEAHGGLVFFALRNPDDAEKISLDIPCGGYVRAGESLTVRYYGFDEEKRMLFTKSRATSALGFRDQGDYQTLDLSADDGFIEYLNEQPLAPDGIRCVFLNEEGGICGVHVAGHGYVCLLPPLEGAGGEPSGNAP